MNERARTFAAACAAAALLTAGGGSALAQDAAGPQDGSPDIVPAEISGVEEGSSPGWHPMLKASANLSLMHNDNVPGNADGLSVTLGAMIRGELGYLDESEQHEWFSSLGWQLAYSRTPELEMFLKSIDSLDVVTSYLYHIPQVPWLGPFATLRLKSVVFPGYVVKTEDTTVVRQDADGNREPRYDLAGNPTGDQVYSGGKRIELTDAFAPTSLRETVGLFAVPLDKEILKIDGRLGVGAWETWVRDGYAVADDAETPELELKRMEDSVQLGAELWVGISGVYKEYVAYAFNTTLMYPFYIDRDTDLEGGELFNAEFEILIGIKFEEWISLDYSLKAYHIPLVVEDWQVSNALLLSITASII